MVPHTQFPHWRWQLILGVACLISILAFLRKTPETAEPVAPAPHASPGEVQSPRRPVYRYSVVKGGVYSSNEVKRQIAADPLVADHYRGLNVPRLMPVALKRPVKRYVSYRKDGKVYWTRSPRLIPKGEVVLTDGRSTVRARCGNRLSETEQEPTLSETDDAELETVDGTVAVSEPLLAESEGLENRRSRIVGWPLASSPADEAPGDSGKTAGEGLAASPSLPTGSYMPGLNALGLLGRDHAMPELPQPPGEIGVLPPGVPPVLVPLNPIAVLMPETIGGGFFAPAPGPPGSSRPAQPPLTIIRTGNPGYPVTTPSGTTPPSGSTGPAAPPELNRPPLPETGPIIPGDAFLPPKQSADTEPVPEVPEPAPAALIAFALVALSLGIGIRKRSKSRSAPSPGKQQSDRSGASSR